MLAVSLSQVPDYFHQTRLHVHVAEHVPGEDRCIMVQILDFGRERITIRAEDESYDKLFFFRRGKLLLVRFITTYPLSVVAMVLRCIEKERRAHTELALCASDLTKFPRR